MFDETRLFAKELSSSIYRRSCHSIGLHTGLDNLYPFKFFPNLAASSFDTCSLVLSGIVAYNIEMSQVRELPPCDLLSDTLGIIFVT